MSEYRVVWEIDIDAESYEEAARKALEIHRDPDSIATVFSVIPIDAETHDERKEIDLLQLDEEAMVLRQEVEMERAVAKREGKRRKHYPEN